MEFRIFDGCFKKIPVNFQVKAVNKYRIQQILKQPLKFYRRNWSKDIFVQGASLAVSCSYYFCQAQPDISSAGLSSLLITKLPTSPKQPQHPEQVE